MINARACFYEPPDTRLMVVRADLNDPDWDKTILLCIRCKYSDEQKLTDDYLEISCLNKNDYEKMRQTNWCRYWGEGY